MSQFYLETPAGGIPTVMFDLPDTNQVAPDGDGIIFFTESAGIDITNSAANTINFALDITEVGTIPDTFTGDSGSAQPSSNNLNILGGEGIDTSGSGATITIAGEDASDTNKGIASFVAADFSVTSGAVSLVDTVVKSVASDSGTATPASHSFSIVGGEGIDTSGATSIITISGEDASDVNKGIATFNTSGFVVASGDVTLADSVVQSVVSDSGTATPTSNSFTITGGTGVSTSGSGATITIAFDVSEVGTLADTFTADTGSAAPALNNLNVIGGEGIDTSGATDTLTISGEDASDTNKGIASFVAADFSVTSGAVSLVDTVVKSVGSDSGSATPSSHAFSIVGTNGISTSGSGSTITIDGSGVGGGGITWNEVTGTTQAATVDNGYYCNNASLVTVTLPDTAAAGSVVRVAGKGAGLFKVAQNAGETIHFLGTSTTTGTGGSITATDQYGALELLCITADTTWIVLSSTGNFTIA